VSTDGFQTAAEFFGVRDAEDRERPPDAPRFAKSIVWVDVGTPIFCCEEHVEDVRPLRWTGDANPKEIDVEVVRAAAFAVLFENDPTCDVCDGDLAKKVDP